MGGRAPDLAGCSVATSRPIRSPRTAWQNAVTGGFTPEGDRTDAQREAIALATTLADELVNADALLFAIPLYNYGVSQHVKTWFDLAYTDPRIDPQGTALRGKPATLVTVLGGTTRRVRPRRAGTTRPRGCVAPSPTCGASTSGSSSVRSPSSA